MKPRAWRPGTGRLRRATQSGARPRTGPTRSPCWRSRTPPGNRNPAPVCHGRMMVWLFTFYRGAAKIMAADLKDTPVAGLDAQLCGDAHPSNFGAFASPERVLLFHLNDFDETLPGPFEYDVKRMAASFTIAARNNGFSQVNAQAATLASVRAYRDAMATFAQMPTMDIWYAHLDEDESGPGSATPWLGRPGRRRSRGRRARKRAGRPARRLRSARDFAREDGPFGGSAADVVT